MQKGPKCVSCQETNLFWIWHIYEHKQEDIELKGTVVQSYYGSTKKRKRRVQYLITRKLKIMLYRYQTSTIH
jgi:hypothetical protein